MKKTTILTAALCASLLPACTRKAEKAPLPDAAVTLGPVVKDTKLALAPLPEEEMIQSLRIQGEIDTPSYLRLAEDLKKIAANENSEATARFSRRLVEKFFAQPHSSSSLGKSLYLSAIIGEGELPAKEAIAQVSKEINGSLGELSNILDGSVTGYPWPQTLPNLTAALTTTDEYAVWLVNEIGKRKLSPSIAKPVQAAIKSEYQKQRPRVVKGIETLHRTKTLDQAVNALKEILQDFGVDLGKEANAQIDRAHKLSADLASMKSSQDALTLIIQIWKMTDPKDRKEVFKSAPEIYDFLNGKDPSSLSCLEAPICLNPILEVARRIVILPKISNYGVQKIHDQIDSASRDYLVDQVRQQVVAFLPQIPGFVKRLMLAEGKTYQDLIASIQNDFEGFARKSFARWADKNFPAEITGLEADRLSMRILSGDKVEVAMRQSPKGMVQTGAETIGLSLAVAQQFLPGESSPQIRSALLSPVLKLLAISGFRQPGGKTFPSLLYPLDGPTEAVFDIKDLLKGKTSFAVPDSFLASDGLLLARKGQAATASVGAQAELLRGISRQILFHRDWEKNLFDEKLGNVQVEDVVTEVPPGSINFSAFPKDIVFALSVGSAGAILQNIILNLSPAFLMLPDKELLWGDHYKEIGEGKISTVAGLVDIKNGVRGNTVKTADLARYILALDEFLTATEGIENTKSAPLLEKDADGVTVVEQIAEARRYLRLFQMGLTNFLVYVAQDKDGGFQASYTIEGKSIQGSGLRTLTDQVLAIRALLATSNRLQMPLYSWAALDGYFFMNRRLWSKEHQFYSSAVDTQGNRVGVPALPQIASTLRGIEELAPYMTGDVRAQWRQVAKPWLRALEDF